MAHGVQQGQGREDNLPRRAPALNGAVQPPEPGEVGRARGPKDDARQPEEEDEPHLRARTEGSERE